MLDIHLSEATVLDREVHPIGHDDPSPAPEREQLNRFTGSEHHLAVEQPSRAKPCS